MHEKLRTYVLLTLAVIVAVWGTFAYIVTTERDRLLSDRATQAQRISQVFEEQTRKAVLFADGYIKTVRREYLRTGDTQAISRLLEDVPIAGSIISHITLVDNAGTPIFNSAHALKHGVTAADRPYFRYFAQSPTDMLYVSQPRIGRNSGKTLVRFVRPLLNDAGTFEGVVFAAVETSALVSIVRDLELGADASAMIVGTDKKIRARTLSGEFGPGDDISDTPIWQELEKAPSGICPHTSAADGIKRYYAYRKIPDTPLIVLVGIPLSEVDSATREFAVIGALIAFLVTCIALGFLHAYNRTLFSNDALAESEERFRDFTLSSSDWLWEMDSELRFTYMSEQIEDVIGVSPATFLGRSRMDFASANSPEWREHMHLLEQRKPFRRFEYAYTTPAGEAKWVSVSGIPIFGSSGEFLGYRGSGADMTSLRQAEQNLKRAHDELEIEVSRRTQALKLEIAERKLAERQLRKNEDQLRDFGAAAADWYWETDADGRFSYFSEDFERITGVPRENRIGQVRGENGFNADDPEAEARHLEDVANHRPFRNFIRSITTPKHGTMWISSNGKPTFSADGSFMGYRGTGTDVTGQVRAEKERTDLLAAIDTMPEPVAVFDTDDCFAFTNKAYKDLNSEVPEYIENGKSFYDYVQIVAEKGLTVDAVGREADWIAERMKQHHDAVGQHESRRSRGRWFLHTESKLPSGGRVLLLTEITDLKKTQLELLRAKDEAEDASRAKSEFLSRMSHELRTPLNAILGFSQTLAMDPKVPLTERQKESVSLISSSGRHLLDLISEVLELARIEAGKMELNIAATDVTAVVAECIDIVGPIAEERSIELSNGLDGADVPNVLTDPTRLRQILLNLVTNAVKYNGEGGRVFIAADQTFPEVLRISVSDTGPGIEEKYHRRIFEPFDRLGKSAEDIDGTGIGLALSRQLADALGGALDFSSIPGEGSTFWVEFPIASGDAVPVASNRPREAETPQDVFADPEKHYRFLYVEDNRINIQLMQSVVGDFGNIELSVANDGETGIRMALDTQPDVILMDIGLPGIDGIDAVKILKAQDQTRAIPVIAITAAAMPADMQRARGAGFFAYLTKPLDIPETIAAMTEAVSPPN